MDIKIGNQVVHLSNNEGSKTNQMQEMIRDYGKVRYDELSFIQMSFITMI